MSVRDDLIAARALIEKPENWSVEAIDGTFNAWGAIVAATGGDKPRRLAARDALNAALPSHERYIADFEECRTTTHADVLALFDRAIAAADAPTDFTIF